MIRHSVYLLLLLTAAPAFAQSAAPEGILLLAHGGQPEWNDRVNALATSINRTRPIEVAFGMASRPAIQAAVDRLTARGVTRIVAVPLFVSSHSSVITSTAYLLGLRADMPPELKAFAKMNHAGHGAAASAAPGVHDHHGAATVVDNTSPVTSRVPIRMTEALNRHALIGSILVDRARSISQAPANEAVILVAHGPVPDADNERWLADMKVLAEQVHAALPFAAVDYLTVRDDAPQPVRDAATAQLRGLVSSHASASRRVLIVPLLLSYGGIEKGIRQRLDGLDYTMAGIALMPDDRIEQWVREAAGR